MQESNVSPIKSREAHFQTGESELSLPAGIVAGIIGSLVVIPVVTVLVFNVGEDIWIAPRSIASVFLGADAETGVLPVIVGTILHLLTGALQGAIFATVIPRLPRAFWVVAGLIFGVVVWVVSSFIIVELIEPVMMIDKGDYLSVLLIGHVVFGIAIGLVGATYDRWPKFK